MDDSQRGLWLRRISPTVRILIAMVLGGSVGAILGPRVGGAGRAGEVVIGLIKMLAAPLILFAVLDSFLRSTVRARSALLMAGIAAINAALAMVIGLTLANSLRPGRFLSVPAETTSSPGAVPAVRPARFLDDLLGLLPPNIVDPFRTNPKTSVIY